MRTTLTIDDDLARALKERAHLERRPFKVVVNDAIRSGLQLNSYDKRKNPFRVQPNDSALVPGPDPNRLNQLVDQMEREDFVSESNP